MPKLSPEKPQTVVQKLRQLGFEGPFGGGKHLVMRHPESGVKIPVPFHGGRALPIGTLRAILRQASVTVEDRLEL